jgi:hypothetical protein
MAEALRVVFEDCHPGITRADNLAGSLGGLFEQGARVARPGQVQPDLHQRN